MRERMPECIGEPVLQNLHEEIEILRSKHNAARIAVLHAHLFLDFECLMSHRRVGCAGRAREASGIWGGLIGEYSSEGSLCNIAKGPALNRYAKAAGNTFKKLIMKQEKKVLPILPVLWIKLAVNAIDLHFLFYPE